MTVIDSCWCHGIWHSVCLCGPACWGNEWEGRGLGCAQWINRCAGALAGAWWSVRRYIAIVGHSPARRRHCDCEPRPLVSDSKLTVGAVCGSNCQSFNVNDIVDVGLYSTYWQNGWCLSVCLCGDVYQSDGPHVASCHVTLSLTTMTYLVCVWDSNEVTLIDSLCSWSLLTMNCLCLTLSRVIISQQSSANVRSSVIKCHE